jgi:hypothetical protein
MYCHPSSLYCNCPHCIEVRKTLFIFESNVKQFNFKTMNENKTVRAKFSIHATKNDDGSMSLSGSAVTSGCEENKAFNDATPSGNLSMHIAKDKEAQNFFEAGVSKEYYLDITLAPVAAAADTAEQTSTENTSSEETASAE